MAWGMIEYIQHRTTSSLTAVNHLTSISGKKGEGQQPICTA